MNEPLWFACGNPEAMLDWLRHKISDRKLRWYSVACLRRLPPARFTEFHWHVVKEVEDSIDEDWQLPTPEWGVGDALEAMLKINAFYAAGGTARRTLGIGEAQRNKSEKAQCGLLREIFGNPFRPATVDPDWLTSTVVALARQMYEARDFSIMPILADALQDAGCDNDDILTHCRGDGPHVRGCWVVDLLLGKK
jgi:hypothetical protein